MERWVGNRKERKKQMKSQKMEIWILTLLWAGHDFGKVIDVAGSLPHLASCRQAFLCVIGRRS